MATQRYRLSLPYTQPQGGTDNLIGTGNTLADAVAEFNAKATITAGSVTVGVLPKVSFEDDQYAWIPASAVGYNSDLVFIKNGLTKTVGVQNMRRTYFDNSGRLLQPVPADVAAFATAWRDGNGVGGYTCIDGHTRD